MPSHYLNQCWFYCHFDPWEQTSVKCYPLANKLTYWKVWLLRKQAMVVFEAWSGQVRAPLDTGTTTTPNGSQPVTLCILTSIHPLYIASDHLTIQVISSSSQPLGYVMLYVIDKDATQRCGEFNITAGVTYKCHHNAGGGKTLWYPQLYTTSHDPEFDESCHLQLITSATNR